MKIPRIALRSFKKEKYSTKPSSKNGWYSARDKRLKIDNFKCKECGSNNRIQVHHVVPVSKGGSHSLSNLTTLCYKCHAKQHPHLNKSLRKSIKN